MALNIIDPNKEDILASWVYWSHRNISPEKMLKYVNCKVSTVYIYRQLGLITRAKANDLCCDLGDFKKAYPQKWQEIQTEVALQKLKDA